MPEKTYHLAVGRNREDKNWRNNEVTWPQLVDRLKQVHRTPETFQEYVTSTKERQTEIKDIGGYVTGYIAGGKRKAEAVTERSILALEVDEGGWWPAQAVIAGRFTAFLHTTHKHSRENPRYRILLPLTRAVAPGEFEALSRLIAGDLGVDLIDHTCHQINRLMYWPSASVDGEYLIHEVQGLLLDPDSQLNRYGGEGAWRNMSLWPRAAKEREKIKRDVSRQIDPLTKPGIVGAFCRAFTIQEVIERFLEKIYEGDAESGRYTYKLGSTANGLVIYEDKFAYSHHSTDPAGDTLCNAFDLVRLQLFGNADQDSSATTARGTPSFSNMAAFAENLPEVRRQLAEDRWKSAREAFGAELAVPINGSAHQLHYAQAASRVAQDFAWLNEYMERTSIAGRLLPGTEQATYAWLNAWASQNSPVTQTVPGVEASADPFAGSGWVEQIEHDNRGVPKPSAKNLKLIFSNDPLLKGLFYLDLFSGERSLTRQPPWTDVPRHAAGAGEEGLQMLDADRAGLRVYIESNYGIGAVNKIADALDLAFQENSHHPVRDYLKGLTWDGRSRVDTALIDAMAAEDSEYTRIVTRKTLVGAIARVFKPGCKFDHVLTLTGAEGLGKSTFAEKMGMQWHSSTPGELGTKAAAENLRGTWIMELGDLSGVKKGDLDEIKNYVTTRKDRYRPAYGHEVVTFPRQSIYIANSNSDNPLKDEPGNRRWWPVAIGDREEVLKRREILTQSYVDQLWAEALHYYRSGETWWLTTTQEDLARARQAEAVEVDPWEELIRNYLRMPMPDGYPLLSLGDRRYYFQGKQPMKAEGLRTRVCAVEVWEEVLASDRAKMAKWDANRINKILEKVTKWGKLIAIRSPHYGVCKGFRVKFCNEAGGFVTSGEIENCN